MLAPLCGGKGNSYPSPLSMSKLDWQRIVKQSSPPPTSWGAQQLSSCCMEPMAREDLTSFPVELGQSVGLIWLEDPSFWSPSIATTICLLFMNSLVVGMTQFDFGVLLTDSFVHREASINFEKDGKVRCSRKTRYLSFIPYMHTLTSTSLSTGSTQSSAFSWYNGRGPCVHIVWLGPTHP